MKRYIRANMNEIPQKIKDNNQLIEKYKNIANHIDDIDDPRLNDFINKMEALRTDNSKLWREFADELDDKLCKNDGKYQYTDSNGDIVRTTMSFDDFGLGNGRFCAHGKDFDKEFSSFNKFIDFLVGYNHNI